LRGIIASTAQSVLNKHIPVDLHPKEFPKWRFVTGVAHIYSHIVG